MTFGMVVSLADNEHVIKSVVAALSTSVFTIFLRNIGLLPIKKQVTPSAPTGNTHRLQTVSSFL